MNAEHPQGQPSKTLHHIEVFWLSVDPIQKANKFSKASVLIHVDMTDEEWAECSLVVVKIEIMITSSDIFLPFNKAK